MPGANNGMTLNNSKLKEYMTVVKEIQKTAEFDDLPSMGDILRLPNIFTSCDLNNEDQLTKKIVYVINNYPNSIKKANIAKRRIDRFSIKNTKKYYDLIMKT